ncbi:hypothetical protein S7711_08620 [Stachybotrys chartarum IBT 7711]|uniref:Uncharacterized protein n=1 Tax=Stachybotrys chartarum (strain CBS 109288 / IBT 7711) TaxID=1280523 RepID=A0A084BCJ5_STACB|nr:hypothetical protein S7711_08620 [Stachybotrys chartarum IBT 7711]KFA77477.1 hypothetical protein S40288_10294 [Stachybotrys chartarum IBT 40288]
MDQRFVNRDDSAYEFLQSATYSSACPTFRHGLIVIPKAKHFRGCSSINHDVDWAAFQVAILGTGHMFEDLSEQEDALLAEDISAWFADFGFAHPGLLISAPTSIRTPTSISIKKSEQSATTTENGEHVALFVADQV